jgi:hypothetical protein
MTEARTTSWTHHRTHRWIVKRRRMYFYAMFVWRNHQSDALRFRLKRVAESVARQYEGARVVHLRRKAG